MESDFSIVFSIRTAPPPPPPRHKLTNENETNDKSGEKSETDSTSSSVNGSITSMTTSSVASSKSLQFMPLDSCPLSPPPSQSDVFYYEDVDAVSDSIPSTNTSHSSVHSRESSLEVEHVSPTLKKTIASSESAPSFGSHVAPDKASGKKRGLKFLSRSSKKKMAASVSCEYTRKAF